jgi:hypothetical protein
MVARELFQIREEAKKLKERQDALKKKFDDLVEANGVVELKKEGVEAFWKFTPESEVPAHTRSESWSIGFRRLRKEVEA